MARARFGNSGVSQLLSSSQQAYDRVQAYNDSMASYVYELSPKTDADFKQYQSYLSGRIQKTTDPSKALSLQKTITTADRSFRSAEIFRQTLSVNYGEQSDTDKYHNMTKLYQDAINNGDYSQAQSIEGQLATLSMKIQNAAQAASDKAAASGRKAAGDAIASVKTDLNTLDKRLQTAFNTGQPIDLGNGQHMYLDAKSYAINKAKVLAGQHELLSQQAAADPKYQDDLATLENSKDYQGLIGSGLADKLSSDPNYDPLGMTFGQDKFGNNTRDFAPLKIDEKGNFEYGLVDNNGKSQFVQQHKLNTDQTAPNVNAIFDTSQAKDAQGNAISGMQQYYDPLGFSRGQQTGSNVAAQKIAPGVTARAVAYNDKNTGQESLDQRNADLQSLVKADLSPDGHSVSGGMGVGFTDIFNPQGAIDVASNLSKDIHVQHVASDLKGGFNTLAGGMRQALSNPGGALANVFNMGQHGINVRAQQAAAQAAQHQAEVARQQQATWAASQALYAHQQAIAAQNAAAAKAHPSVLWTPPKPVISAANVAANFTAASGGQHDNASLAKGIAGAIGYKIPKL